MDQKQKRFELQQVAPPLAQQGKEYWRSLEELAQTEEFQEILQRDFPRYAAGLSKGMSRRKFLGLMGASLALAGLTGCISRPREFIVPYVVQPEGVTPGIAQYYATAMPMAGYGNGLLVKSLTGRPIKAEGNPSHPACPKPADAPEYAQYGPTDAFAQASLLGLYDPDRSRTITNLGEIRSWDSFVEALNQRLRNPSSTGIDTNLRIRILTETVTSPSLAWQIKRILQRFPQAKWHVFEPVDRDNSRRGGQAAFGEEVSVKYHFDKADVILSLDADFLQCGPGSLRYTRDFSSRRHVRQERATPAMNRLYVVESMPSITGATADHRWPMRAGQIAGFARAVAEAVGVTGLPRIEEEAHNIDDAWIRALAQDLNDHRGSSLVIAGESQPPFVHALAHALNEHLGNIGETSALDYIEPVESHLNVRETAFPLSLRGLVDEMAQDEPPIDLLLILGGNPVYGAPADFRLKELLLRDLFLCVHLSLYDDETSEVCHWHINEAHYLESWGDVRAFDGTVSIIQPLIAPLYGGKTASEVLSLLADPTPASSHDIVRSFWQRVFTGAGSNADSLVPHFDPPASSGPVALGFDDWWQRTLHNGVMEQTASPGANVTLRNDWAQAAGAASGANDGLEIVFKPDPAVYDGRFANNGWLQELPKPITKLTWDNAAFISPATAVQRGFALEGQPHQANGKEVRLQFQDREIRAPLWVLPGHADDSITVHLGYGRTRSGRVGNGAGFNAYQLRTSQHPWFGGGLTAGTTGSTVTLACTQHHFLMDGRDLVRSGTIEQQPQIPETARADYHPPTLYAQDHQPQSDKKWGMVMDLTKCTGCSACVVACQAENNIPVVGKGEVSLGREMHWLRIDTYYSGTAESPEIFSQPVPCMHCEHAPCELVCPVEATVHSDDGLNDMVYNRCVGTRYCSNNCPYKVRRFNFYQYADFETESLQLLYNPEVTVRSRGVIEKCTYCVQRIRQAEIDATVNDRDVGDGDIQTACQAACPAGAIVFGDLNQKNAQQEPISKVGQYLDDPLNYGLLTDQNTRPRTTYLASLKNPNAAITATEEERDDG